jgi:uncharacterized protein YjbI with pentapeptide repeats
MIINGHIYLVEYLKENFPKRLRYSKDDIMLAAPWVYNKVFKNYHFTGNFSLEIKNCKFIDCSFENISGFFFIFSKCKFEKCKFKNSRFSHLEMYWDDLEFNDCEFRNVQLDEGALFSVLFNKCHFYGFNMLGFVPLMSVYFIDCNIENAQFQSLIYYKDIKQFEEGYYDLNFTHCSIDFSYFNSVDLRNSILYNTTLYKTAFIDCQLSDNSIVQNEETKYPSYASIDFQTILKSTTLDYSILKKIFNINDLKIKETVSQITTQLEFKKVFISFSFKDLKFAKRLYDLLTGHGIRCFFWIKDAPPGQALEDIMTGGVHKNDKILFIASENSLKSPACQYELSEGRKKQEETWENIIFPIHIDGFLFKVKKNQIRPLNKADEYWENIEEIKRINSYDLSAFNKDRINNSKFKESVVKIINELKLK